jgi:hypothetical protein
MARVIELTTPDLAPYTEAQVRFAVGAWPLRAAEELRSALIFRALAVAARRARMPPPWPARFADAMRDELRHARLCAVVGKRLGAGTPRYDASRVRARLASLPEPILRAAALLVVEVAVRETISLALFRAGRRAAVEPLTRATLTAIAGDEARHQHLGWTGATAIWPLLWDADRAALQREVVPHSARSSKRMHYLLCAASKVGRRSTQPTQRSACSRRRCESRPSMPQSSGASFRASPPLASTECSRGRIDTARQSRAPNRLNRV